MKKNNGFTLAEVLITLTIIGIVAAILFPSILANYNERTLNAKRQALYARMSQAIGQFDGLYKNYESVKNCSGDGSGCEDNGSAMNFITSGLSNAYKIAAICDKDNLVSCDIPTTITRRDGTTYSLSSAQTLQSYSNLDPDNEYIQFDTDVAGFRTKNGESILLMFNPRCDSISRWRSRATINESNTACINMVYDLNGGKNKPNRVGEDIGFMTAFNATNTILSAPKVYNFNQSDFIDTTISTDDEVHDITVEANYTRAQAMQVCPAYGENIITPSLEDMYSIVFNQALYEDPNQRTVTRKYFTTQISRNDGGTGSDYYETVYMYSADENHYLLSERSGTTPDVKASVECIYE